MHHDLCCFSQACPWLVQSRQQWNPLQQGLHLSICMISVALKCSGANSPRMDCSCLQPQEFHIIWNGYMLLSRYLSTKLATKSSGSMQFTSLLLELSPKIGDQKSLGMTYFLLIDSSTLSDVQLLVKGIRKDQSWRFGGYSRGFVKGLKPFCLHLLYTPPNMFEKCRAKESAQSESDRWGHGNDELSHLLTRAHLKLTGSKCSQLIACLRKFM